MTISAVSPKPKVSFKEKLMGYIDLTRAHFAIVWPLLFCSGLMLAFHMYGVFSWSLAIKVIFIGLFGFEAGMVLNDIVDYRIDEVEPDETLTNYWRPFKKRPIPSGIVSLTEAIIVFAVFALVAIALIATLPFPNFLYLYGLMLYTYAMEVFYQLKKRKQKVPIAQLLGRTDLVMFPIAGYLCLGQPNIILLGYILFLYPWAIAHLGANDIVDIENDKAKNLQTIPVFYGLKGSVLWVAAFSLMHIALGPLFWWIFGLSYVALGGIILGSLVVLTANILLIQKKTPERGMKILPLFHASLFLYTSSIILDVAIFSL